MFENPREGRFALSCHGPSAAASSAGVAVLDFDHDGWMDFALPTGDTRRFRPYSLAKQSGARILMRVPLPATNWVRAFGVAAFDYDNDGWVDLVAVGETADGKGEVQALPQSRS